MQVFGEFAGQSGIVVINRVENELDYEHADGIATAVASTDALPTATTGPSKTQTRSVP